MATRTITGIHHITAIASDPRKTVSFYRRVLGLRLVKLTVNFDDPGTYHLYFGNHEGAPGSILTFFPWVGIGRGQIGVGQVTAMAFAVPPGSFDYWAGRLRSLNVNTREDGPRFGERVMLLTDTDGMPLEIIETTGGGGARAADKRGTPAADEGEARAGGDGSEAGDPVPAEHAIHRFHGATLSEEGYERTADLLAGTMGWEHAGNEANRFRYRPPSGAASFIDLVCAPDARAGRLGAGTVHHIAYRTRNDDEQAAWRAELVRLGHNVSPVMDRRYFHSIYYREPGGVLFEIATDPPGFAIDEPPEHLGERLMLPPWLESHREFIERSLPPLDLS